MANPKAKAATFSWFRMHNRVLEDPQLQQMDAELFRFWVNLLAIANQHDDARRRGYLPKDMAPYAYTMHISEDTLMERIEELVSLGLLEQRHGRLRPKDWPRWQFASDSSTPRSQLSRERAGERRSNGTATLQQHHQSTENRDR